MKSKPAQTIAVLIATLYLVPSARAEGVCPPARTLTLDLPREEKIVSTEVEITEAMLNAFWNPFNGRFESIPMDPQPAHGVGIPKLDLCTQASREPGMVRLRIAVSGDFIAGEQRAGQTERTEAWISASVDGNRMRRANPDRYEYLELIPLMQPNPVQRQLRIIPTSFLDSYTLNPQLTIEEIAVRFNRYLQNTLRPLRVLASLERLGDECAMSATVSGDVGEHFFGAVAFFNAQETAVAEGMMAGTLADQGMHEQLDGFVGMMGGFATIAKQQGVEIGLSAEQMANLGLDEDGNPLQQHQGDGAVPTPAQLEVRRKLEETLRPPDGERGDDFGLSLTDFKLDTEKEEAQIGSMPMADAFTLTLSGALGQTLDFEGGGSVEVAVSTLTMTAGLLAGRGAIKFKRDEAGELELILVPLNKDLVMGELRADMETEGVYQVAGSAGEPRQLEARVNARFFAKRGFLSCVNR